MTEPGTDPRTVDVDGFVIGTDRLLGQFGGRPSVGGLGATVAQGDRVGLIAGLDTDPDTGGLLLHLTWLPDARPDRPISERARNRVMRAVERGAAPIELVPALGLVALDAWMPPESEPVERDEPDDRCRCGQPDCGAC